MADWVKVVSPDLAHHLWSTTTDKLLIIEYKNPGNSDSIITDYELSIARPQLSEDMVIAVIEGHVGMGHLSLDFCNTFLQGVGIYVFADKVNVAMFPAHLVARTMKSRHIVAHINDIRSNLD